MTNIIKTSSIMFVLSLALFTNVSAEVATSTLNVQAGSENSVSGKTEVKSEINDKDDSDIDEKVETEQSEMANFVKALLSAADREKGIGAQVRVFAKEQQDSNEASAQAMAQVESRSKIKTFFFGSDYKNLGTLRSEMVKTKARIEALTALANKATNASVKASLMAQIDVLKNQQLKIEQFISLHEKNFSLFGWLQAK
jgi:hypothetical protein